MYSIFLTILLNCRTIDCDVLDRQMTSKKKTDLGCEYISRKQETCQCVLLTSAHTLSFSLHKGELLSFIECQGIKKLYNVI